MRVLVTGHQGYIGPAVVETLIQAGHRVAGLDSGLYVETRLEPARAVPTFVGDVRDVRVADLRDFDAVVHLAGLSSDPLGALDPRLTDEINTGGTLKLAESARAAGVRRFVFSSSCSVYGAASEPWIDERSALRPLTAYARSKATAEQGLLALASRSFCVVSLRNATAFGYSPHLRSDVVVNDFVTRAFLQGEVRLTSDGAAWRPLVHIRDIARAIADVLQARPEAVNRQIVNVGATDQNFTIIQVAQLVASQLPGVKLSLVAGAASDQRSYRVRFDRLAQILPQFRCEYDLSKGVADLLANLRRVGVTSTDGCVRLAHLQRLQAAGAVDESLRPVRQASRHTHGRIRIATPTKTQRVVSRQLQYR